MNLHGARASRAREPEWSAGVSPACTPEAYPRWHARRRRAHPGQALWASCLREPERRAGVSRASRLRGHDALAPSRNATATPRRRAGGSLACMRAGGARTRGRPSYRGGFFGKPLRSFSRFGHQDAQTPPSPLVGEGGREDEGQKRIGMPHTTYPFPATFPNFVLFSLFIVNK